MRESIKCTPANKTTQFQKPGINFDDIEIKEEEKFVKEKWFKAYYRGNALIPQAGVGIALSLFISTIEDKNIDWDEFFNSQLSPEQISFLGNAMSVMHNHKGIQYSNAEKAKIFTHAPKIIHRDSLQRLWEKSKLEVLITLISFIREKNFYFFQHREFIPDARGNDEKPGHINEILDFFNSPKNIEKIKNLNTALTVIKTSFEEESMRALLDEYRNEFNKKPTIRSSKIWEKYGYKKKFEKIIFTEIKSAFGGNYPKYIKYLFR